jgi:hypothetical protein
VFNLEKANEAGAANSLTANFDIGSIMTLDEPALVRFAPHGGVEVADRIKFVSTVG